MGLDVSSIIIGTMYDGRKKLNRQIIDKICNYSGDKLLTLHPEFLQKDSATNDYENVM